MEDHKCAILQQRRCWSLAAILILVVSFYLFTPPDWSNSAATAQTAGPTAAAAERIVALTNKVRAEKGLPPLAPLPPLHQAALSHSEEMLELDYFSHNSPVTGKVGDRLRRAGTRWTACAENIYRSTGYAIEDVAAETVDAWVRSPGHYKNIISPGYTHIGVGVVYQSQEAVVTQVFVKL